MGDKWDPYFTLDPSIAALAKRINKMSSELKGQKGEIGYPGTIGPTGPMPVNSDNNSIYCFHEPSTKALSTLSSSATNNISLGRNTLNKITSGNKNIAIGDNVLEKLEIGRSNIGIGLDVLKNAQTVGGNTASFNVGIGEESLQQIKKGESNVAVGTGTLKKYENLIYNTAIGHWAMQGAVGSTNITNLVENNTALGRMALWKMTGNNNTGIGFQVLKNSTTSNSNCALGYKAGYNLITGDSNVIIGSEANVNAASAKNQIIIGAGAKDMGDSTVVLGNLVIQKTYLRGKIYVTDNKNSQNTAIGEKALDNLKYASDQYNVGVGHKALNTLTVGERNVAIGAKSLDKIDNSSYNIAVGFNAGNYFGPSGSGTVTSAQNCVFLGNEGLLKKSTAVNQIVIGNSLNNEVLGEEDSTVVLGNKKIQKTYLRGKIYVTDPFDLDNVTLGDSTLAANITGFKNIAIGRNALKSNRNGYGTVAIGDSVLALHTGPTSVSGKNVAIGMYAMQLATGDDNVGIGRKTLRHNTSTNNTALGIQAMEQNRAGSNNTAVGIYSLQNNNTGNKNTAIGVSAGNTITSGRDNILIGYRADTGPSGDPGAKTAINQIVIGSDCFGLDNNTVVLGNTQIQKTRLYGKVGIGKDAPGYPLEIATGGVSTTLPASYYFHSSSTGLNLTSGFNTTMDISIKTDKAIWALTNIVASDRRIKENIHEINDNSALQKLRSIQCYYYNYKDKPERGYDSTVGFIAQEVKEHLPMAVNILKDIIPNEMRNIENPQWTEISSDSFKLTIPDLEDVSANTKYRFYMKQDSIINKLESNTMEGDTKSFLFKKKYNEVFLYGKEVDDFHTLKKEKLFALNFSASQELDRIQQEHKTKIAALEAENTQLKADIAAIKAHLGL